MLKENIKLNELTNKTYKWLNLNHFNFTNPYIDYSKKYEYNTLKNNDVEILNNLELLSNKESAEFKAIKFNDITTDVKYGVSDEVVKFIESNNNKNCVIHVKANLEVKTPIILEYVLDEVNNTLLDENIIITEPNSNVTVVIKYATADATKTFHMGLTKIFAGENSTVNVIKLQDMNSNSQHYDSTLTISNSNSNVTVKFIEIGSNVTVSNYVNYLNGDNSKTEVKSIYLGSDNMTVDMNYNIIHRGIKTESDINVYGVVNDSCKKVFRGTIDFKRGSKNAIGSEQEHAIILSKNTRCSSIPLLLCEESDVIGAHAASVGKIDENKLFYLMSRGFTKKQAKKLIIEGTFSNVLDDIHIEELKNEIAESISRRIV